MILRPRQKVAVQAATKALNKKGNTITVAPTGAGKTIILSSVVGQIPGKHLILQHRKELVEQNVDKYLKINPDHCIGYFTQNMKTWDADVIFGMVQSVARNKKTIPWLDMITIDEAHHTAAKSYADIIDYAREKNPDVKLYGVTATPQRGDQRGLRKWFDNCSDQIKIGELIQSGHLVKPRTFVVDVGKQEELMNCKKTANEYDMSHVEKIMNHTNINDKVVEEWKARAGKRQTVVFCSTVSHAIDVKGSFQAAGIYADIVHGDMSLRNREIALKDYDSGETQVMINVAVLTEGWDSQPTSCIVLLRPSSQKSTFIQMIGRGLRTIDQAIYPGVIKKDCLVLDFGTSSIEHGSIEQEVELDGIEARRREAAGGSFKKCPSCGNEVPIQVRHCSFCEFEFGNDVLISDDGIDIEFTMSEIDLMERSTFRWVDLFGDSLCWCATGFTAWAILLYNHIIDEWMAVGRASNGVELIEIGDKMICWGAADDFMLANETESASKKSRSWQKLPATEKQSNLLTGKPVCGMNRYQASCGLTWQFNKRKILKKVEEISDAYQKTV